MKMLKIWSLAAMLLMTMVACNNKNNGGSNDSGSLDKIQQEWELVSVNGVAVDFKVYISFTDGTFAMYQQLYSLDYKFFDGEYSVSGNTLSGSYFSGEAWKCDYTGGITNGDKTLTLKSKDKNSITCVYEACVIPEDVKAEATSTRSADFVPFL